MKNKFLLQILLFSFITVCLFQFTEEAHATSVSSEIRLSYAGGTNLIDPDNVESNQTRYSTANAIYLPETEDGLFFQVYFGMSQPTAPYSLTVEFFDIDYNSLGQVNELKNGSLVVAGDGLYYGTMVIDADEIPANAFSFTILDFSNFSEDFISEGGKFMVFCGDSIAYTFEDFYPHEALVDLSKGDSPIIEVSYDSPLSHDDITEMIECSDGYLGDLKKSLNVVDEAYLSSPTKVGCYEIKATVSDGTNTTTGRFFLKVVDKIAPSIDGPNEISLNIGEEITDDVITSFFDAEDDYDGDLSDSIQVTGTYEHNPTAISDGALTLKVTDTNGNSVTKDITIHYVDITAPAFTMPSTLTLSYQLNMTLSKIISEKVSIEDNCDTAPVLGITMDTYTGNERRVGTYKVAFSATDASGNQSSSYLTIIIADEIAPVIYLNTYSVDVTTSVNLSKIDFENLLYTSGELSRSKHYTSAVLVDTYTGHESEPGQYAYKVAYTDNDGNTLEKEFIVNVGENTYIIDSAVVKQMSYKTIGLLIISGIAVLFIGSLALFSLKSRKLEKMLKK